MEHISTYQSSSALPHGALSIDKHQRYPNAEAKRIECLMLSPVGKKGTFCRIGVIFFEMQHEGIITEEDYVVPDHVQAQWIADRSALLEHFRTPHVSPEHYVSVDGSLMYTITII